MAPSDSTEIPRLKAELRRVTEGWIKTIGGVRKLPRVALPKVGGWATWTFAAYDLIRLGGIGQWWEPWPT